MTVTPPPLHKMGKMPYFQQALNQKSVLQMGPSWSQPLLQQSSYAELHRDTPIPGPLGAMWCPSLPNSHGSFGKEIAWRSQPETTAEAVQAGTNQS